MIKKMFVFVLILLGTLSFSESYFIGDGRKDLKIQVEIPELKNIGDESAWLPEFVVNTISDGIAKYSNIEIVDTHNAQRVADAQRRDENANFSDAETVEAGNFSVARNVLLVSITGKSTSYALSIRINDKEKNVSIAAHNKPNCSYEDLESGKALTEAVDDLLCQLKVELTSEGRKALLEVGTVKNAASISAQKLVAQGTVAQQKGSNIEALSYFIQAATSDDSLERALKAMSNGSQIIAAGDFGTKARNLIQRRNEFKQLIATTKSYFEKNIPYLIVYDPNLQMGKINYEKETFDMTVTIAVVKDIEKEKIYKNIIQAYESETDSKNWGLDTDLKSVFPNVNYYLSLQVNDKNGKILGKSEKRLNMSNSLSNFACWEKSLVTLSADADTSNIVFSVPKIVWDKGKEKTELSLNRISVSDYVNKVFLKSFVMEEVVRGVCVCALPNYNSKSDCNGFLKAFGFSEAENIAENLVKSDSLKMNQLMYSKEEYKILEEVRSYQKTPSGSWAVQKNKFYLNENNPGYPRSKAEYSANPGKYLPFEFVRIPGSEYKFAKKTDELKYMLERLDSGYRQMYFEYWRELIIFGDDSRNVPHHANAYSIDEKMMEKLRNTSSIPVDSLEKTNYLNSSDREKFGSENHPLRDFTDYIEKNPDEKDKLLAVYTLDFVVSIKKNLPKMQSFTSNFEISKDIVDQKFINQVINTARIEKLGYEFKDYNIEASSKFELVLNAMNELLGYKPFLLNSQGSYAHSLEEVIQKNYETDGYMFPRETDYAECPAKLKKSIDKAVKKNGGKYLFIMRKK